MAKNYCDSMLEVGQDSAWAEAFKEKIELTLVTCENNMNHRIQLFPYFQWIFHFLWALQMTPLNMLMIIH